MQVLAPVLVIESVWLPLVKLVLAEYAVHEVLLTEVLM